MGHLTAAPRFLSPPPIALDGIGVDAE